MDTQMKIDAAVVKALREEKSWSQEHLASASGLSARTVQRVEAEGLGSSETRLALAAALGVPAARLAPRSSAEEAEIRNYRRERFWGWFGLSAGTVCSAAGILAGAVQGHLSPGEVGASLGLLGAFAGISAAILGVLDTWARRRGSAP